MVYTLTREVRRDFAETVGMMREALAASGFGVLTEIDLQATLKAKLDVDVPAQVILGACRPNLAHAAIVAEPSIAVFLPCNVVVRDAGGGRTIIEAMDPGFMIEVTGNPDLGAVGSDARLRIEAAMASLRD